MSKLDKSWKEEVPNYTDSCKTTYIAGASAFQERTIRKLKREISIHKKCSSWYKKSRTKNCVRNY